MNILIYSHFYYPESGAASIRMQYFVDALKKAGHIVKIIAPIPNYPNGKEYYGFNRFFQKNMERNITYLPIYVPKKDGVLKRLFSYLSYFASSIIYSLLSSFKPDIVISSSPPIFTSLAASFVSKVLRAKFILDIRDIWPDIGIELGIIKSKTQVKLLRRIEKLIMIRADKIIVTAEGDKRNIISKKIHESKLEVIYN